MYWQKLVEFGYSQKKLRFTLTDFPSMLSTLYPMITSSYNIFPHKIDIASQEKEFSW